MKTFAKQLYRHCRGYTFAMLRGAQTPTTKFVLFFRPRSGSTVLCDLLNSHSDIHCDGEIFGGHHVLFPQQYLTGQSVWKRKPVYGFKLNIFQIRTQRLGEPQTVLANLQQQGWRVIYTFRENSLRQAVSFLIAQRRNEWIGMANNRLQEKVVINCDELVNKLERIEVALQFEKQFLASIPHLAIGYEKNLLHAEHHQATLNNVFAYLGVEPVTVQTRMMKTSASSDLKDMIANYDEVAQRISQTPYAAWLTAD